MLWQTECQSVDSHFLCSLPGDTAGIVSGSLQLHQTCPQMADGITAHDQSMVLFRSLINCLVQSGYNLRTGL